MKGEKNSFNLYVINKLTKPMTRLVKTIIGSQTATLLRNRFPKHVCIYGLTPCFTMRRLKIFRRIKTLPEHQTVPCTSFLLFADALSPLHKDICITNGCFARRVFSSRQGLSGQTSLHTD